MDYNIPKMNAYNPSCATISEHSLLFFASIGVRYQRSLLSQKDSFVIWRYNINSPWRDLKLSYMLVTLHLLFRKIPTTQELYEIGIASENRERFHHHPLNHQMPVLLTNRRQNLSRH